VTRTTRRLAVAVVAVLLLAGCGDGPVRAGAAAVVGDERIEVERLREFVDRGLADPQAKEQFPDRADYQRQVLNRMVRAQLLERAAEENGVSVTQGEVDEQLADFAEQSGGREQLELQAAANGIAPEDLPGFAREIVLETELGDAVTEGAEVPEEQLEQIYEQNIGQFQQVRSRHILVEDEATARAALARVQADPESFPEVAAELSTDTSNKDDGGDLGLQGRGTFVPQFDEAVFTEPLNEPFVVQTEFGWHVVEVLERQTTTLEEATPDLRRGALAEQRQAAVLELLQETAERVGVTVNPRFGRWDAEQAQVVAVEDDGVTSPEPSPSGGVDEVPVEEIPAEELEGGAPAEEPAEQPAE